MQPDGISLPLVREDVRRALQEDVGGGDITAALIDAERQAEATVISREHAVLCGQAWFEQAFWLLDESVRIDWRAQDGDNVEPNQILCVVYGPARVLLTGERSALNFLQTLSGTATATRRYVDALGDSGVQLLDTRKTIPGLRQAQKYAVRCAGGRNHRMGLYDGVLIKENHIAAAGSIGRAVDQARHHAPPGIAVEVEVEDLQQLREALAAGADIVLLDNMEPDLLRQAVAITAGQAKLEASGGITLDNIRAVADTGVDYISIGAITKHVQAVDLSMRINI
ncbi:carboxylating nicotinate-nucleotide diphosphorylase [Sulfurivermis fontis]|uniref:carboxylating nicotinate-nucleotide diphosphorylase n=1 Tax=Sulfurivermis fontis TaxID=1972068 RepID=UPI0015586217|nr:carboxylating nicotinate-nucleotide diphosphorylase [Sulfurivermis fontis]